MMVYIAGDSPLPLIEWSGEAPAFHVKPLADDQAVSRQFVGAKIHYVGSHEGCGCGFQYGNYAESEDDEDYARARDSRRKLAEYLQRALTDGARVELFACWDGDQGETPDYRSDLTPSSLLTDRTYFHEREYVTLSAD